MRDNKYLKLVMLLSVIGFGIAAYLVVLHVKFSTGSAGLTEGCGIGSGTGCIDIAVSKYSSIFGVPLAAIAMGAFLSLLVLGFLALSNEQGGSEPTYMMFLLATISVIVTVTMFIISNYVLREFCVFCAMLWVVNLAIWPCLVKQLGLGWGNALAGNLELLGGGKANLRRERVTSSFTVAVVCVILMGVGGLVAKGSSNKGPPGPSTMVSDFNGAQVVMLPAEAYGGPRSKGFSGEGAPVLEIAELADFQCPGCKMAGQFLRSFELKHKGKVRVTYLNFPLDGSCNPFTPNGGHKQSCALARGGICAAKQGKFWPYHDNVFDKQEEIHSSPSFVNEIVKEIGLDVAAYEACLKDPATETELQKDMQYGEMVNLESTPTIIVNQRKMIGARTPADYEALLDSIESQKK